jgi:hypothetical protein
MARRRLEFCTLGRNAGHCDGVCCPLVEISARAAGGGLLGCNHHFFRCHFGLAAVDDAAPPWEVAAGVAGLFALHWVEFRLQEPRVLRILRRIEGPVSRGFLAGVALLLILIPATNVNPFIYFRF